MTNVNVMMNVKVKLRKVRGKDEWIDKVNGFRFVWNPFFGHYQAETTRGLLAFAFSDTLESLIKKVEEDRRFWYER